MLVRRGAPASIARLRGRPTFSRPLGQDADDHLKAWWLPSREVKS